MIATFDPVRARSFVFRTAAMTAVFVGLAVGVFWFLGPRAVLAAPVAALAGLAAILWFPWLVVCAVRGLRPDAPLIEIRNDRLRYAIPTLGQVDAPADLVEDAVIHGRVLVVRLNGGGRVRIPLDLALEDDALILERVAGLRNARR